ncbi:MAG: hypothetical protein KDL87_15190, partial [Verrucomicrobiae bacterium]|nr:hypothetical protein [Verrucomicrobiae bacterium]
MNEKELVEVGEGLRRERDAISSFPSEDGVRGFVLRRGEAETQDLQAVRIKQEPGGDGAMIRDLLEIQGPIPLVFGKHRLAV